MLYIFFGASVTIPKLVCVSCDGYGTHWNKPPAPVLEYYRKPIQAYRLSIKFSILLSGSILNLTLPLCDYSFDMSLLGQNKKSQGLPVLRLNSG